MYFRILMDFVPFPNLHRETIFQDFSECRTILVSGSVGLLHSLTGHSLKVLLRTHRNHLLRTSVQPYFDATDARFSRVRACLHWFSGCQCCNVASNITLIKMLRFLNKPNKSLQKMGWNPNWSDVAGSHCNGNGIIFIILVLLNVDFRNGYSGTKWRCSHGNDIFKSQNCRCWHSVNKAILCKRWCLV